MSYLLSFGRQAKIPSRPLYDVVVGRPAIENTDEHSLRRFDCTDAPTPCHGCGGMRLVRLYDRIACRRCGRERP